MLYLKGASNIFIPKCLILLFILGIKTRFFKNFENFFLRGKFQPYQLVLIFLYFLCYFESMANVNLTILMAPILFVENFEFLFEIP